MKDEYLKLNREEKFKITFAPSGRGKARCPANPAFPHGMIIDLANDKKGCVANVPYPAPECGLWIVECHKCGTSAAATTAGRTDDPITIIIQCKDKK